MAKISLKKAVLKIKDGGSNELTVKIGDGNLTWDESKKREYILNRGLLDEVRDGDDEPLSLKFDFNYEFLKASTGSGTPTVEDALKQRGEAASWASVDSDACRPYAVDLEFTYTPACSSIQNEVALFEDFRWEQLSHDPKAGTISCSGKCNKLEPTVTRSGP